MSDLPDHLSVRIDITNDGHAHVESILSDEETVGCLREIADGIVVKGMNRPNDDE